MLGANPGKTAVIEDNPSGVASAKAAGCKVIAYPNGFSKDMDFSNADVVISDLSVAKSALGRLNRYV